MTNGFKTFKLYTALKLHFTNPKFDVFKNRGHLKGSYESFISRNDHALFEKLGQMADSDRDLIKFIAANFMYDNFDLVYNLEIGERNFKEYKRRQQSITHIFRNDLDTALKEHCRFNENNLVHESIPDVINLYLQKKISLETMVILDRLSLIMDKQKQKHQLQMMFGDQLLKVEKSSGFVKYDHKKVYPIFEQFLEEANHEHAVEGA